MKADTLNPSELRAAGYKALAEALGPVGMARFLQQFERGRGEYYGKHSQILLQVNHEAFPSTVAWSAERTPIAQHIYPLRGDLAQSILLQSIGFCGNVECSRDPPLYCMAHPCCVCRVMEALKAKNCTAIRTEIGWSLSD